jgi:hypothetical protein
VKPVTLLSSFEVNFKLRRYMMGHFDFTKLLMKEGADPARVDRDGNTVGWCRLTLSDPR